MQNHSQPSLLERPVKLGSDDNVFIMKLFTFTFLVLSSCTLINSYILDKQAPATLKRGHTKALTITQLATLKKKPIQLPGDNNEKLQDIPEIPTPKQSSGCSNVNFAFTAAGQQASLTSTGYSGNYPPNQDCSYFLTSPAGTTMSITCDIKVSCNNGDYIYFSTSGDGSEDIAYCGTGTVPPITSDSNSLSIGFYSSPYTLWGTGYNYRCTISVSGSSGTTTTAAPPTTTTQSSGSTTVSPNSTCTCGIRNPNGATRIVGGAQTKTGELPWRVTVFVYNPTTGSGGICGGTIISNSWVMTAAHCTMDFKSGMKINVYTEAQANPVTVGGGVTNLVDRYVQHPSFNRNTMDNDITLLHLSKPLTFKSNVSPACLPWNMVTSDFSGINVLASGWGTTKPVAVGAQNNDQVSDTLLSVTLPVLSTAQCLQYLSGITQNQICTYLPGKDTCQGDSGGSIDYQGSNSQYYSIGIVSWGYGCAQQDNPGVYTKVTNYLSWIQSTTADNFCKS